MAAASGICRQRLAGVAPMLCADVEQPAAVALQLSRARADQSLARAGGVGNASAAASSSRARTSSGGYTNACANIVAGSTRGGPCNRSSLHSVISGSGSTTVGAFNRKSSTIKATYCTSVWFDPHGTPYFHGLGTTTVASVLELGPGRVLIPCQKLLLPYNSIISQWGLLGTSSTLVEADFVVDPLSASDHLNLGPLLYASQLVPTSKPMVVEMVRASELTVNESMQSCYKTVFFPGGCYFAPWDGTILEGLGTCARGPDSTVACLNLDGVLVKPPGFGYCSGFCKYECLKAIDTFDINMTLLQEMWKKGFRTADKDAAKDFTGRLRHRVEFAGTVIKWVCFLYPIAVCSVACYTMSLSPREAFYFACMLHDDNKEKYSGRISEYRIRCALEETEKSNGKLNEEREKERKSLENLVKLKQQADVLTKEARQATQENIRQVELVKEACQKAIRAKNAADLAREVTESIKLKCESDKSTYEKESVAHQEVRAKLEAEVEKMKNKTEELHQEVETAIELEAEVEKMKKKTEELHQVVETAIELEAEVEEIKKKTKELHQEVETAIAKKVAMVKAAREASKAKKGESSTTHEDFETAIARKVAEEAEAMAKDEEGEAAQEAGMWSWFLSKLKFWG